MLAVLQLDAADVRLQVLRVRRAAWKRQGRKERLVGLARAGLRRVQRREEPLLQRFLVPATQPASASN